MAQMGSFVPAQRATFRIHSQLFAQLNHNDSIEMNASSFMVEMRAVSMYVKMAVSDTVNHNHPASSLVIMDELGRGTSANEGAAIGFASFWCAENKSPFCWPNGKIILV
ncbi:MutS protein-like protein [Zancudomyces culisetae]|uniref:MutS protein-like protein n=1 Tax=Zancudomyces culisetae TaxID=1213189 RepID=A0A1R1PER9_ZANCU|nr:MutS protein-like protein [Zancudomyces culisetae]|eukprot:OMH79464.1 MutS protein-like protein [Zancudomyces culisetae]